MKTKVVIFDLYGTLVKLPTNRNPYFRLCKDIGRPECIRKSLVVDALTLAGFCDNIGVEYPDELESYQNELDEDVANASLFSDALPTLKELKKLGFRLGLISNLATPYKRVVKNLKLESNFDALVFSCDIGIAKPDPAIYQQAISKMEVTCDSVVMVGDSYRCDVQGPKSFGIEGFLLDRLNASGDSNSIRSLREMVPRLELGIES